ncbi:hypothetical protein HY612_05340 [Candidatus Roizmanbacteria bacterium]|nr:hypothetical protein [Candidatus Roizmanbacteria bacterium]
MTEPLTRLPDRDIKGVQYYIDHPGLKEIEPPEIPPYTGTGEQAHLYLTGARESFDIQNHRSLIAQVINIAHLLKALIPRPRRTTRRGV